MTRRKRLVLPSFNREEFIRHVERGPHFGCWSLARARTAWGRRGRCTARAMARLQQRNDSGADVHMSQIVGSMLSREAWEVVYAKLDMPGPVPQHGGQAWGDCVSNAPDCHGSVFVFCRVLARIVRAL